MTTCTATFGIAVFSEICVMGKFSDCRYLLILCILVEVRVAGQTVLVRDESTGENLHFPSVQVVWVTEVMNKHIPHAEIRLHGEVFWADGVWNVTLAAVNGLFVFINRVA